MRSLLAINIAEEQGWEEGFDRFEAYAKEGIRKGKKWSEFVHGPKGNEIPLEDFLP